MRTIRTASLVAVIAPVLATGAVQAQTPTPDGWVSYGGNASKITCDSRPVLLTGNHTDLTLSGPCRTVRLAGNHNDVVLTIVPGGTIEITGAHNDVFWHPIDPARAAPILLDRGQSNTFHKRLGDDE